MSINIDRIPYIYPTSGKIVFFDDFENAGSDTRWVFSGDGSGDATDGTYAYTDTQAMRITTGGTADQTETATTTLGVLNSNKKVGLASMWSPDAAIANLKSLSFNIKYYNGTTVKHAGIQWVGTDATLLNKWQYLNSSNAWTDVTDGGQTLYTNATTLCPHGFKMIVDFEDNEYMRFFSDWQQFSVASTAVYSAANTTYPRYEIFMTLTTETGNAILCYFDNVLFTVKER